MVVKKPISIDFREPQNLTELAKYIGIKEEFLDKRIQLHNEEIFFHKHIIPKRNFKRFGEFRIVWEAYPIMADAYKAFSRRFDLFVRYVEPSFPHSSSYGYLRGRGTVDNAKKHCKNPLILHADIKNFFPTITRESLKNTFIKLGINKTVADLLSKFVTIKDELPLGLHASPLLANIVCLELDRKLSDLAKKYECSYTRYADDITISGKHLPTKDEVKSILNEEEFLLSERKFRITKTGQAHYVTGLSVADSKPHVPKKMKKLLRQELYYCNKYGVEEHINRVDVVKDYNYIQRGINRIDGMVRYISHIERDLSQDLQQKWQYILKNQGLQISYDTIIGRKLRSFNFYVDESEFSYKGKQFLALCFTRIEKDDFQKIEATTIRTHRNHIVDPFAGGKKETLIKKGLHFVDCNEDLKKDYIEHLCTFPFRAYVAYGELKSQNDYKTLYENLIKQILPHRLMSCDGGIVGLIFEENSKIKQNAINDTVNNIYNKLKETKDRRPIELGVVIGKKLEHPCFSIPDFLLGIFGKYASLNSDSNKGDRKELFFEKLRDKYRIIYDYDSKKLFIRKRPFLPF